MMTIDQREKQTRLQARMDELRAEIAFAQKGEKPWPYRSCLMREGRGYCEKHGKYRTHILVWIDRNGEDREKISCCPDCLIAEASDLTNSHNFRCGGVTAHTTSFRGMRIV